jgi:hypothetical protein
MSRHCLLTANPDLIPKGSDLPNSISLLLQSVAPSQQRHLAITLEFVFDNVVDLSTPTLHLDNICLKLIARLLFCFKTYVSVKAAVLCRCLWTPRKAERGNQDDLAVLL